MAKKTGPTGAFTLDAYGGCFVDRIEGDHGTVPGLSRRLLGRLWVQVTDLWR